jgi:hypothetical protein
MRPIEKRIAAVEARTVNRDGLNLTVVYCPVGVEPKVFREQKAAELGTRDFMMVVFVAPGGIKPQPCHALH